MFFRLFKKQGSEIDALVHAKYEYERGFFFHIQIFRNVMLYYRIRTSEINAVYSKRQNHDISSLMRSFTQGEVLHFFQ